MVKDSGDKDYWRLVWLRFKDGDKEAFAIFYNQHIDGLYQYGPGYFCSGIPVITTGIFIIASGKAKIARDIFIF